MASPSPPHCGEHWVPLPPLRDHSIPLSLPANIPSAPPLSFTLRWGNTFREFSAHHNPQHYYLFFYTFLTKSLSAFTAAPRNPSQIISRWEARCHFTNVSLIYNQEKLEEANYRKSTSDHWKAARVIPKFRDFLNSAMSWQAEQTSHTCCWCLLKTSQNFLVYFTLPKMPWLPSSQHPAQGKHSPAMDCHRTTHMSHTQLLLLTQEEF